MVLLTYHPDGLKWTRLDTFGAPMTPFRWNDIGFLVVAFLGETSIFAHEGSSAHPIVSATIGVAPIIVNRYYLLWHYLKKFTWLEALIHYSSCWLHLEDICYR